MTVAIVSHNHDGIRINIDGIVDVYANAIYMAESLARYKITAKGRMEAVEKKAESATTLLNFMRKVDTTEPLSEHEIDTIVRQGVTVLEDLLYAIIDARKAIS